MLATVKNKDMVCPACGGKDEHCTKCDGNGYVEKKDNNLSWRDRLNTLQERTARGTQKYASVK